MTFRLRILPRAERDAQHLFDWLRARSPDGAIRWWFAFDEAVHKLVDHPTATASLRKPSPSDMSFANSCSRLAVADAIAACSSLLATKSACSEFEVRAKLHWNRTNLSELANVLEWNWSGTRGHRRQMRMRRSAEARAGPR